MWECLISSAMMHRHAAIPSPTSQRGAIPHRRPLADLHLHTSSAQPTTEPAVRLTTVSCRPACLTRETKHSITMLRSIPGGGEVPPLYFSA